MAKWASGLVSGLRENCVEPLVVGHQYEQAWPGGRLFPGRANELDSRFMHETVRFSNFPFIRNAELKYAYARSVSRILKHSNVDCLLTYNPLPWHVHVAKKFQANGGLWINIVLDYDENDLGNEWSQFTDLCGHADGQVFLSWWAYENAPVISKLHLDSGVSSVNYDPATLDGESDGIKRVVYAGKITPYGGSELMAETYRLTPGDDVEFLICGRGQCSALQEASRVDPRIKLIGFVDDDELDRICRSATVFFNPRDPSFSNNRMIFPSKILQYMSYCKPIVSTRTDGLAPDYDQVLQIARSNSAVDLASALQSTLEMSSDQILEIGKRQHYFITEQRSWKSQAARLVEFIQSIVKTKADR